MKVINVVLACIWSPCRFYVWNYLEILPYLLLVISYCAKLRAFRTIIVYLLNYVLKFSSISSMIDLGNNNESASQKEGVI